MPTCVPLFSSFFNFLLNAISYARGKNQFIIASSYTQKIMKACLSISQLLTVELENNTFLYCLDYKRVLNTQT